MLERAHIEPPNVATYQLTWRAVPDTTGPSAGPRDNPVTSPGQTAENLDSMTTRNARLPVAEDMVYPIRYEMRTEIGQGPLEMLALRGFVLPSRIFVGREPQAVRPLRSR